MKNKNAITILSSIWGWFFYQFFGDYRKADVIPLVPFSSNERWVMFECSYLIGNLLTIQWSFVCDLFGFFFCWMIDCVESHLLISNTVLMAWQIIAAKGLILHTLFKFIIGTTNSINLGHKHKNIRKW